MVSNLVYSRSKSAVFAFITAVVLAGSFAYAAPAFATVQPDACDALTTYTKSSDFSDSRVLINFSDSDKKITVSAQSGYVVTSVKLDVQNDNHSGLFEYATGPVTNLDPNPGTSIDEAKVVVKKVCVPATDLIVKKVIVGGAQGDTADDFSFKYDKQGNTPAVLQQFEADGQNNLTGLANGAYDITEVSASGWTTTYSSNAPGNHSTDCNNITVNNGNGPWTCTITNTKIVDVCPNIASNQTVVPEGYTINDGGICVPVIPTANISATKIICNNEATLPNWGLGGHVIGATTASDFVSANAADCHFAEGWSFEWGSEAAGDTPDDFVGPAGNGYTTFGTTGNNGVTSAAIPLANISEIHLREVLQPGYIGFTHGAHSDNSDSVSAEFYCTGDALNYDNWDFIRGPQAGSTYYCVAFNAPSKPKVVVHKTVVGSDVSPINFSYSFNGGDAVTFNAEGDATSVATSTGAYNVVETFSPSYNATYSADCTGTITAGQTKNCTITNTFIPPVAPSCDAQTDTDYVVSNTSTTFGGNASVAVTNQPSPWTTALSGSGAIWIWGEDPVSPADQTGGSTEVFTKEFTIAGTPTGATLEIAADNTYSVSVNGHAPIISDSNLDQFTSTDSYAIPASDLVSGSNTIVFTVTNAPWNDANPAGLVYKLSVNRNACIPAPVTSTVTMCKVDQNQAPLSGWTLMLKGGEVEQLDVNSSVMAGINTLASLTNGMSYIATVNGTWTNQSGANPVDAEYSTTDGWSTQMDGYTGYSTDILELQIDNSFDPNSNWGAYNASHTYARSFLGTGNASNFRIFDGTGTTQNPDWFGDNSGSLNVHVADGYAGVTDGNGCVTFTGVPMGAYTADEVMQDGWTNVSGLGEVIVDSATENFTIQNTNAKDGGEDTSCVDNSVSNSYDSDTTTVWGGMNPAVAVATPYHSSWTANIPTATWIWNAAMSSDPENATSQTFTKTFTISGTPTGASLVIAADNGYSVSVNGNPICSSSDEDNYTDGAKDTCVIDASALVSGVNAMTITVNNLPMAGGTSESNPAGLKYSLTVTNNTCEMPADYVTVTIAKYIDGEHADTAMTGDSFPMRAAYDVVSETLGHIVGNDPYPLMVGGSNTVADFEAKTLNFVRGGQYSTYEDTTTGLVGTSCDGDSHAYELIGYSWGNTWTEAQAMAATTTAPNFTNLDTDKFVIVHNHKCGEVLGAETATITIAKYIDGQHATVENTDNATFNMLTSFDGVPQGHAVDAPFTLSSAAWGGFGEPYEASFIETEVGANYATHEVLDGITVGASCSDESHPAYELEGYYVSDNSFEDAMESDRIEGAPNFTNLQSDKYVIVNNHKCTNDNGDDQGTLVIIKKTTSGSGSFTFSITGECPVPEIDFKAPFTAKIAAPECWTSSPDNVVVDTTTSEGANTGSESIDLDEGNYTVAELAQSGWHLTGSNCVYPEEGDSEGIATPAGEEIYIEAGETVTCTFTNAPNVVPTNTEETIVVKMADLATSFGDVISNPTKWFFYDDNTDTINNTLGSFVAGPSVAPIGSGSSNITLDAVNTRTDIATYAFSSTTLSSIATLKFSAYSHSGVAGATESPYLVFNVTFNGADNFQKRLVYVPSNNGAVPQDTWNTFDAINGGNAMWVYSGSVWPTTAVGPDAGVVGESGAIARSWSDILADYPVISVRKTDSFMGVRVGEPGPDAYTGNVDKFVIGITTGSNTDTKTFDFEPTTQGGGDEGGNDDTPTPTIQSFGGGGNGPIVGSTPAGRVLGASTSLPELPAGCDALLHTYMRKGLFHNDVAEVKLLQVFLNGEMGTHIPVTGVFGPMTDAGVRAFQNKYASQVLTPWGLNEPTGFVYRTTQRWINLIHCKDLNIPMPDLIPYSQQ